MELVKLVIAILIPAAHLVIWEKIKFHQHDDEHTVQYIIFLILASLSMVFTISTTIWSTLRIRKAQQNRREN